MSDQISQVPRHFSVLWGKDDEGWWVAQCECGWEAPGVFPDSEDAADVLMQHAFEAGLAEARAQAERWSKR